jgi:hypothetical protein
VRDRRVQAMQRPDRTARHAHFPHHTCESGSTWYRNHTDRPGTPDRGVWWFSSSPETTARLGSGRFDLPDPFGTCYLADTANAAVNELIGPDVAARGWVEEPLVDGRVVSRIGLPQHVWAANVSVSKAARFRITAEFTATGDYDLTQDWARIFHRDGFGGIRYALRFTPGQCRGLAWFGPAGAPHPTWPGDPDPEPMRERLEEMDFEVVPIPTSSTVNIVDP